MKSFRLAWRNIWRNKRRTLITASSILLGVFFSTVMTSMQEGMYSAMIDNIVSFYTGNLQVQHLEFNDSKSIDDLFSPGEELIQAIESDKHIIAYSERMESFAMAASDSLTYGALIIGMHPDKESAFSNLNEKLERGQYLKENDEGVLVSEGIATYLQLDVNDTIVLISQGYHGVSAEGKFPIRGILKFPLPEMNKSFLYMSIQQAMEFYSTEKQISSVAVLLKDHEDLRIVQKKLSEYLPEDQHAIIFDDMMPEIIQGIESDRYGGIIFKGILYVIIAFGILGTVMMMVNERRRELGVTVALGMQKMKLAFVMVWETILITSIGLISGILFSLPINLYYAKNPIGLTGEMAMMMNDYGLEPVVPFSVAPEVFFNQVITIGIFSLLIAIYPMYQILKLNVSESIRG